MTRNLKALGLCLMAVFALGAMAASAAQAEGTVEYFHADKENTVITAHGGEQRIGINGFTLSCQEVSFEGTQTGTKHELNGKTTYTSDSVTVKPHYYKTEAGGTVKNTAGCTTSLGAATVSVNECHYKLFATTTETAGKGKMANLEIICPEGKKIEIATGGVTISIGNQLIKHSVSYTGHSTAEGTIGVTPTAEENISYTCAPAFPCIVGGLGTSGTTASYSGAIWTFEGFEDVGGSTGSYVEGSMVPIWQGPTG